MKYGAVIVAAGMSSRMKKFKPLMEIHGMSMAQRIISTFRQTGIREIVMVTGYQAGQLEEEVKKTGVVCIRNENYEATEMFDSAKLGLSYLQGRCDAVFFTPVDVPLFTQETTMAVRDLNEGEIRIPVCEGHDGHPVYIQNSVIPEILNYKGERGLRGAIELVGRLVKRVTVEDQGIFMDADTREDFENLIRLHDRQLMRPQVKVRLVKKEAFFGPGTASLLRQIRYTESVSEASKSLGISYSKAREMIRQLEEALGKKMVIRCQGGKNGGNAVLTDYGRQLLENYEKYESELEDYAIKKYREIF